MDKKDNDEKIFHFDSSEDLPPSPKDSPRGKKSKCDAEDKDESSPSQTTNTRQSYMVAGIRMYFCCVKIKNQILRTRLINVSTQFYRSDK